MNCFRKFISRFISLLACEADASQKTVTVRGFIVKFLEIAGLNRNAKNVCEPLLFTPMAPGVTGIENDIGDFSETSVACQLTVCTLSLTTKSRPVSKPVLVEGRALPLTDMSSLNCLTGFIIFNGNV